MRTTNNNGKQDRGLPCGRFANFEPVNNGHAIEP
jgi:hypothetical protein